MSPPRGVSGAPPAQGHIGPRQHDSDGDFAIYTIAPSRIVDGQRVRDTFDSLATRFHVRRQTIEAENPDADAGALRPGQQIRIPLTAPRLRLRLETAKIAALTAELGRRPTLAETGKAPPARPGEGSEPGLLVYTISDLAPTIRDAVDRWVSDPADRSRVFNYIACIIRRESRDSHATGNPCRNWHTHADGTGTGLIGLDPAGHLEQFRRWACPGTRGPADRAIRLARPPPPELQIWYLARALSEMRSQYGSWQAAVRAWHNGTGADDASGSQYLDNVTARLPDFSVRY